MKRKKILIIDNYDSFTYNLVQYLGELGAEPSVYRNDQIKVRDIKKKKPDGILISPGPRTPLEAGISNDVIRRLSGDIPILGVCLGHQCLGYVFGGEVVRARRIMHGKASAIYHNRNILFKNIKNPFQATRYHSLVVNTKNLPKELEIIARTDRGEIMGLKHKKHPTWGVQFHPESILTTSGKELLKNFLKQL